MRSDKRCLFSRSIDCAGILKLRNADIELKKGETDIGRKNTRVRVVFRVAIPQPDGQILWLQTASIPVECCESRKQEACVPLKHARRRRRRGKNILHVC